MSHINRKSPELTPMQRPPTLFLREGKWMLIPL